MGCRKDSRRLRQTDPVQEADGGLVPKEGGSIGREGTNKDWNEALVQGSETLCLHGLHKHTADAMLVLACTCQPTVRTDTDLQERPGDGS